MITEVNFIISNWCNLKCPHCLQNAGNFNDEVPIKDVIKFLETLPDLAFLKITGGEPLSKPVYPRTKELLNYAINRGLQVEINTNGTYDIDKSEFPTYKVKFQVSIDGLREMHDKHRGPETFTQTINFIRKRREEGYQINVMCVIHEQPIYTNLDRFLNLIEGVSGNKPKFQYVKSVGRNSENEFPLVNETYLSEFLMSRGCECRTRIKQCGFVDLDYERVAIDEKGNIIPCPTLSQYKFGTVYDKLDEVKLRTQMKQQIGNCTCFYPDGMK